MRAGLLNERIVLEEQRETKTPSGYIDKEWTPALNCRAYRRKLSAIGGDGINASEEFIGNTIVLQVRYNPLINEDQRVIYQGRRYAIRLMDKQTQDNSYLLTCTKLNE